MRDDVKNTRRKFSLEFFRRQVVEQSLAPDTSVAQIALVHGLNANLLHKWRRAYREGELEPDSESAGATQWLAVQLAPPADPSSVDYTTAANPTAAAETRITFGSVTITLKRATLQIASVDLAAFHALVQCLA